MLQPIVSLKVGSSYPPIKVAKTYSIGQFANLAAFFSQISNLFNADIPKLFYIEDPSDLSDDAPVTLEDEQDFAYIKTLKNKCGAVYVFLEKKQKGGGKQFSVIGLDEIQHNFEAKPKTKMPEFINFLYEHYGRKSLLLTYYDTEGDGCDLELELKDALTTNFNQFWQNMLETMDTDVFVKIQQMPALDGEKLVTFVHYQNHKRRAQRKISSDTTFQEISAFIFDKFNKTHFKLILDSQPPSKIQITVLEESSWSYAVKKAYSGSIFYVLDYIPEHIIKIYVYIKQKKQKKLYELNKNSTQFEEFLAYCKSEFSEKLWPEIRSVKYTNKNGVQFVIKNDSQWQIFKEEAYPKILVEVDSILKKSNGSRSNNSQKLSLQLQKQRSIHSGKHQGKCQGKHQGKHQGKCQGKCQYGKCQEKGQYKNIQSFQIPNRTHPINFPYASETKVHENQQLQQEKYENQQIVFCTDCGHKKTLVKYYCCERCKSASRNKPDLDGLLQLVSSAASSFLGQRNDRS